MTLVVHIAACATIIALAVIAWKQKSIAAPGVLFTVGTLIPGILMRLRLIPRSLVINIYAVYWMPFIAVMFIVFAFKVFCHSTRRSIAEDG